MRSAHRLLGVFAIALSAAACGSDGDDGDTLTEQQATAAFGSMQVALEDLGTDLETAGTTGNVSVSASCAGGGIVSADGQWTSGQSFSLDVDFDGCVAENTTIDGSLSYSGSGNESSASVSVDGRITFSGAVNGTCRIDITLSFSSSTFQVSGSICGVSVNETFQD